MEPNNFGTNAWRRCNRIAAVLGISLLLSHGARAQVIVSAQDGKAVLIDGVNTVPPNPSRDHVAIIDIGVTPPRIVGEVTVPTTVVGPPQSVAIAPDESFALVTAALKIDPADPRRTIANDVVSVIDLKSKPPGPLATLKAGNGASGVSINRAGTLALVANRTEGSVSIFTISGRTLTPAGKVQIGTDTSGPSHVVFLPDGKMALVTQDFANKISVLAIDGAKVEYTRRDISAGLRPYSIDVSSNGDFAVVGNVGVGEGDADTLSVIDLRAKPPRVIDTITVGQTPEGVAVSPDGRHVAVSVMNGTNKPKASPFYNDFGVLKILRVDNLKLNPVAEMRIGQWCQGVGWSKDGKNVFAQCMVEREIQMFGFDGKSLKRESPIKLNGSPAGMRIAN